MKKSALLRRIRHGLGYRLIKTVWYLSALVPRRSGLFIFRHIGSCLPIVLKRECGIIERNLEMVYPGGYTQVQKKEFTKEVFRNLLMNLFDTVFLARCSDEKYKKIVKCRGDDVLFREYKKGHGIIAATSHSGCFEMQTRYFSLFGLKPFVIGRKMFDKRVDEFVSNLRARHGVEYIHRTGSALRIVRNLKKGMAFGVLIDQDTDVEGVFADFLGIPAHTPSVPVKMALKMDIPLFVSSTYRKPDNTHEIVVEGPLSLEKTGDENSDLVRNVLKVNNRISSFIREHPEQWVWMHRRWKSSRSERKYENTPYIDDYRDTRSDAEARVRVKEKL